MARPRKDLGTGSDEKIVGMMARGCSADAIGRTLGVSRTTAHRRMQELKGGVPAAREAKRQAAPAPEPSETEIPDELPDGVDLATVDKWIPLVEKAAREAYDEKNHAAFAALTARLVTLLEHKRKATPLPKMDPNDHVDMVAAAERVRKRWHELIEGAG
jgi:hypothetical protein